MNGVGDENRLPMDSDNSSSNEEVEKDKLQVNGEETTKYGHQRKFVVNVLVGIINYRFVKSISLPNLFGANDYFNILEQVIDEMTLNIRHNMINLPDRTSVHLAHNVREWSNEHFPNRCFGPCGISQSRFTTFFWYLIKDKVYTILRCLLVEILVVVREYSFAKCIFIPNVF